MQFSMSDALTVARYREEERRQHERLHAMLREARGTSPAKRPFGGITRFFRGRHAVRPVLEPCETAA